MTCPACSQACTHYSVWPDVGIRKQKAGGSGEDAQVDSHSLCDCKRPGMDTPKKHIHTPVTGCGRPKRVSWELWRQESSLRLMLAVCLVLLDSYLCCLLGSPHCTFTPSLSSPQCLMQRREVSPC